jgi:hypothetical protein
MKIFLIAIFCLNIFTLKIAKANIKSYIETTKSEYQETSKNLYPFVYFDFKTEILFNNDEILNKEEKRNTLFSESNLILDLNFNQNFAIHTDFEITKIKGETFTPTSLLQEQPSKGIFYGQSLLTKELSALFTFNKAKIYIGKISPRFSAGNERWSEIFYDSWYGISGTFLNKGYALDEKLGIKTNVEIFSSDIAKLEFQGAIFKNDNTALYKKPLMEERDRPNWGKRQAGNTVSIKSHSLGFQGFVGLSSRDAISFSIAYRSQFSDDISGSEKGFSTAIQYNKTFFDDLILTIFAENVTIWNAYLLNKETSLKEDYNTISLSLSFAGFRVGGLQNYYKGLARIRLTEYFIGFEVPKTNLAFFVSKRDYRLPEKNISGLGFNIRYRIK